MEKQEFNLSKKMIISNKYIDNFFYEEDVKEFIRLLKELSTKNEFGNDAILIKQIDKLAGKDLL